MTTKSPTVYLVDDDPTVLRSVARLLTSEEIRTVTYGSSLHFLEEHDADTPGCAVLDLAMPDLDGLSVQERLAQSAPDGRSPRRIIIFLTGEGDVPSTVAAMKGGAVDFLQKPVDADALLAAVRRAFAVDAEARRQSSDNADLEARYATLTPRERQVLDEVVAGKLNKQSAAALGTTEKTIKVHRARVMRKMRADSLADLVRMAGRLGRG